MLNKLLTELLDVLRENCSNNIYRDAKSVKLPPGLIYYALLRMLIRNKAALVVIFASSTACSTQ